MRKYLAATAVLGALAFAAPASAAESGIAGRVFDSTCFGPCIDPPPPPPLYTGDGLTVTLRTYPARDLIAIRHPRDGRFRLAVPAGVYRLSAKVDDPCWEGQVKRVTVPERSFIEARLHVYNSCIK